MLLEQLRFQLVDQRFELLETTIDARFDALETRLDARIEGLESRVDALDTKLGTRFDGLANDVSGELAIMRREIQAGFATAEAHTIRWIVGTGVALIGSLSGLGGLVLALH